MKKMMILVFILIFKSTMRNIDLKKETYDFQYNKYVPFNYNVVSEGKIELYYKDKVRYKLDYLNTPLIIKDDDKYYIEYKNSLLYVKKSDVTLIEHKNSNEKIRKNIRTLTYHAVRKRSDKCKNQAICEDYDMFDQQMKYLYDNNYLTLTMEELEMFLDGKINIPLKTIVITLDDGNLGENAIEVLEKYKIHATYFVITSKYNIYQTESKYVKFESHTDNLHQNYKCVGGEQGGLLLCEDEAKVINDLKLSQEKLNGSMYFSYPFFDFNARAINILKKCGFKLAFIGEWNTEGLSDKKTNKYLLRRKTIFSTDSMQTFKSYLK